MLQKNIITPSATKIDIICFRHLYIISKDKKSNQIVLLVFNCLRLELW